MNFCRACLSLAVLLIATEVAIANDAEATRFNRCVAAESDVGIAACSVLLDSSRFAGSSMTTPLRRKLLEARASAFAGQSQRKLALHDYTALIALAPEHSDYWRRRGEIRRDLKQFDKAIADFNEALKHDPENVFALALRGAIFEEEKDDPERALKDYNQLLKLNPRDAYARIARGDVLRDRGRLKEAIQEYNLAIDDPSCEEPPYFQRGYAYHRLKNYKAAIADYTVSIENDDERGQAYINRGASYKKLGQFNQALSDYAQAGRLMPNDSDIPFNRALALLDLKRYAEAFAEIVRARRLKPFARHILDVYDDLTANAEEYGFDPHKISDNLKQGRKELDKGVAFHRAGDSDRALHHFTHALKFDPTLSYAYASRAGVLAKRRDFEKAIADLTRAIELNAKNEVALVNRGFLYLTTNKLDRALADFDAAIALGGAYETALYNKAAVYVKKKDDDTSLHLYKQVVALNPSDGMAHYNIGVIQYRRHQLNDALKSYDASVKFQPSYASAHGNRGVVLEKLGNYACAADDFRKAKRLRPDFKPYWRSLKKMHAKLDAAGSSVKCDR